MIKIKALNSNKTSEDSSICQAGHLRNNLYLSRGSPVMLTKGIHPTLGLNKYTKGKVIDIVYLPEDNDKIILDETIPSYIVVEFPDYKGK